SRLTWTSSAATNSLVANSETLFMLDTNTAALSGSVYSGRMRYSSNSDHYQTSDAAGGIVLKAVFHEGAVQGSAATMGTFVFANGQFQFAISGTSGATYIVQATTNLSGGNWTSISTNTAPFTFTDTGIGSLSQRFYRVVAP